MTKVLINRELLEQVASMELDTTDRSIRIQDEIRAILAQPAQQSEEVEVRGLQWLDTGHYRKKPPQFGYNPHDWNPLMTVAQHQRILADVCQQRDKLSQVLENVEREHDLIRQMKNCEIQRGRGSFGIAVMSDPPALEWQALDKELQQFVDARRAALAASTGQEG